MQSRSSRRGLSTARRALRVVWLLAGRPEGVRAGDVAEALGKSVSTAYHLLASLCEEGVAERHAGGVYRIAPAFRDRVATGIATPAPERHDLSHLVGDLLARTHKRSYLAVVRGGELHIVLERGQQGMPKLPGLEPRIGDNAHALAVGKIALALAPPEVVEDYVRSPGLRRFTAHTITRPDTLRAELEAIRRRGFAVDCEEFDEDFCCIAAPVRDVHRQVLGVIGISMTRRAFDEEHETLARAVVDVAATVGRDPADVAPSHSSGAPAIARFAVSAETGEVLDSPAEARLTCSNGSTIP
jgi:DNA-binding IclR family transcriptional regulator